MRRSPWRREGCADSPSLETFRGTWQVVNHFSSASSFSQEGALVMVNVITKISALACKEWAFSIWKQMYLLVLTTVPGLEKLVSFKSKWEDIRAQPIFQLNLEPHEWEFDNYNLIYLDDLHETSCQIFNFRGELCSVLEPTPSWGQKLSCGLGLWGTACPRGVLAYRNDLRGFSDDRTQWQDSLRTAFTDGSASYFFGMFGVKTSVRVTEPDFNDLNFLEALRRLTCTCTDTPHCRLTWGQSGHLGDRLIPIASPWC